MFLSQGLTVLWRTHSPEMGCSSGRRGAPECLKEQMWLYKWGAQSRARHTGLPVHGREFNTFSVLTCHLKTGSSTESEARINCKNASEHLKSWCCAQCWDKIATVSVLMRSQVLRGMVPSKCQGREDRTLWGAGGAQVELRKSFSAEVTTKLRWQGPGGKGGKEGEGTADKGRRACKGQQAGELGTPGTQRTALWWARRVPPQAAWPGTTYFPAHSLKCLCL